MVVETRTMRCAVALILLALAVAVPGLAQERNLLTVARDGSGQYRSIQAALDAVPAGNVRMVTIEVKNGLYEEKLFIRTSFITLLGADRDSTRIVYSVLRSEWLKAHDSSDWGAATVNIDSNVTDLTFANLTIRNNYGALHDEHGHQFAVRGGGTRVKILNCRVISDGGDALSLWNRRNGMYYHAYCAFEGWVDYVCPRGWCYVTDCTFFGHNLSASIWHDGSTDPDQKFVIRNSRFDGVPGFPLGRNHRDGQFFLLDCTFSEAMKDTPIYWPATSPQPWKWGRRAYYFHCRRDGGDFAWFKDNLDQAEGRPASEAVTPTWTFAGRWDPESEMRSLLPFAAVPKPENNALGVGLRGLVLRWIPARGSLRHRVSFGTDGNLRPIVETDSCQAPIPQDVAERLVSGVRYAWRVDETTSTGVVPGPVWHFTVSSEGP